MSTAVLSFIIPALNEEKNIANAILSIRQTMRDKPHEILLVDNGSTDNTQKVAESLGAKVLVDPTATIAKLRNIGVEHSTGSVLVFIDADIQLEANWSNILFKQIAEFPENQLIVTGSTIRIPSNPSFIERYWFSRHEQSNVRYINSGHLITTRTLFNRISGFDAHLRTAEDYDFCQRAQSAGAVLKQNKELVAYHYGYPKTVRQFMLREAWHGREDVSSLSRFLHSKSALAAMLNSLILICGTFISLLTLQLTGVLVASILSLTLCLLLTMKKFGPDSPQRFLLTAFCFECYLLGRTLSLYMGQKRPSARS